MDDMFAENLAVVERHGDRVVITIAPRGMLSAYEAGMRVGCQVVFVALFTLAVAAITALYVIVTMGVLRTVHTAQHDDSPPMWLLLPLFWLIAACMWLYFIHLGRRGAVFTVSSDALSVVQSGLFGERRRDWRLDALTDIRVEQTLREYDGGGKWWSTDLRIYSFSERPFKMLGYLPRAELERLAPILRDAAGIHDDENGKQAGASP
jgi:hypothetical protein